MKASLIYPHQMAISPELTRESKLLYLIEEPLFFSQYKFHRQKLMLHRATMKRLERDLQKRGLTVRYVEFHQLANSAAIASILAKDGVQQVALAEVTDDWLHRRISRAFSEKSITCTWLPSQLFLTPSNLVHSYRPRSADFYFFSDFYTWQRRRMDLLMDGGKPQGGRWSFDDENRKKLPKSITVPHCEYQESSEFGCEAQEYIDQHFPDNYGGRGGLKYPDSAEKSRDRLELFLRERFASFGPYEDAITREHSVLFHSVLTPALNIGLLSPGDIVQRASEMENVPLNSQEGFIRQVIGWREFVRLVYEQQGARQRTRNALSNSASLPPAFYTGTTGIDPVDTVIKRVLESGYCHHIERLMVLGNFMLLCDIAPDQVYRWFMELFIDAYDWVMVPNVYGMSQFADGGLMTTKPYVSGSSYILRMSNFTKGPWCEIWDGLYWRFVDRHLDLIRANPRMSVMASMCEKLRSSGKLEAHLTRADAYLAGLFT